MITSKKLRYSARGEQCTVNAVKYCNYDTDTTVLAHLPSDISGYKSTDLSSCYACSSCHDLIDRRRIDNDFEKDRHFYLRRAQTRTMTILHEKGLLKIEQ